MKRNKNLNKLKKKKKMKKKNKIRKNNNIISKFQITQIRKI